MKTWIKMFFATFGAFVLVMAALVISSTLSGASSLRSSVSSIELSALPLELEVNDVPYTEPAHVAYPYGWLAVDEPDVGMNQWEVVRILYCPGMEIIPHADGIPAEASRFAPPDNSLAYILCSKSESEQPMPIDPNHLLVNLPDIIPSAIYDIQYAYSTPSKSGGHAIAGLTGSVLPGYDSEKQFDDYLDESIHPVPAAYGLAVKLVSVQANLRDKGYRLVVWDCYRPRQASRFISERFTAAYNSDPAIRASVGTTWDLSWYAASGASGHNYGSDIDVSVADESGNLLAMPSDFDAFDDSAHLVDVPMNSSSISPSAYRQEVLDNQACLDLHEAMTSAGLDELASEWWHFSDKSAKTAMRALVGDEGLNFTSSIK